MTRGEAERLRDIQDAIAAIVAHIERARSLPDGLNDPLLHDALLFQFVVIGEAVKHLDEVTRSRSKEIPWEDVAGLRDLIAHEYFRIRIERVLEIIDRELPALKQAIERLLAGSSD